MKALVLLKGIPLAGFTFLFAACAGNTSHKSLRGEMPADAFPFEYYQRHIYVDMSFNDTLSGQWVFDSAASSIYPDSAEFAGYPFLTTSSRRYRGAGQNEVMLKVTTDTVTLGNGYLKAVSDRSPVLDLKRILGRKPSGIFGHGVATDSILEINYSKGYMRVVDSTRMPPEGYSAIPIEYYDGKLLLVPLEIKLQSGEVFHGRFIYDTGSAHTVAVNTPTAGKWDLENKVVSKTEQYVSDAGVGGESRDFIFRARHIMFGGYKVKRPLVEYSLNTGGVRALPQFDGIAGNGLFEQFDHILDIPGRTLYIKKGKDYGKEFRETLSGFSMIDRSDITDGFIISSIDTGGAAEKAGLEIGDIVLWINGMVPSEITAEYYESLQSTPGACYIVTVLRGSNPVTFVVVNGKPSL